MFVFALPANKGLTKVLWHEGLLIKASCDSGGDLYVQAETLLNNAAIHMGTIRAGGKASYSGDDDFRGGEIFLIADKDDDNVQGTLTYSRVVPGFPGHAVTVTFMATQGAFKDESVPCLFAGTSFGRG